jgi:energy-coupling factor transport system substrate-specific component
MAEARRHFFTLHELLIMAALAALGGVSSAVLSIVRAAFHTLPGLSGTLQCLAGIHVLWLVVAIGLVRKPGVATLTGVLKGAVELQAGNPHGLIVFLYTGFAGLTIDLIWLLLGGRHRPLTYMVAGGLAAATNPWVFWLLGLLPPHKAVTAILAMLSAAAFVSGVLLGGLLAWWLLRALRRAGVVGPQVDAPGSVRARSWTGLAAGLTAVMLFGTAAYLGRGQSASADGSAVETTRQAPSSTMRSP